MGESKASRARLGSDGQRAGPYEDGGSEVRFVKEEPYVIFWHRDLGWGCGPARLFVLLSDADRYNCDLFCTCPSKRKAEYWVSLLPSWYDAASWIKSRVRLK
jgi:hypothetical protein